MNKRKAKKAQKKLDMWVGLDILSDRCYACECYESGDSSVGLSSGCGASYLYDKDGNLIEEMNDKAIAYMSKGGWDCPYYKGKKSLVTRKKNFKPSRPHSYKEIKALIDYNNKLYKFNDNFKYDEFEC